MGMKEFKEGVANDLANAISRRCAPHFITGSLIDSIKVVRTGRGFDIVMNEYGKYVEFGTRPHEIRPKNKKALAWVPKGYKRVQHKDGTISGKKGNKKANAIFAKVVHHPGNPPMPFIRPALHADLPRIIAENARLHLNTT